MKMAIPFFFGGGGGGGGEGVSEEVETLGEALPLIIDYQGQSKTNDICAVFLFRDLPPPLPEFLDPPLNMSVCMAPLASLKLL